MQLSRIIQNEWISFRFAELWFRIVPSVRIFKNSNFLQNGTLENWDLELTGMNNSAWKVLNVYDDKELCYNFFIWVSKIKQFNTYNKYVWDTVTAQCNINDHIIELPIQTQGKGE